MLIDCPNCARSYHVVEADLGIAGRLVICPRCDSRWFAGGNGTAHSSPDNLLPFTSSPRLAAPSDPQDAVEVDEREQRRPFRFAPLLAVASAGCLAVVVALIGARARIVDDLPFSAPLYRAAGLSVNLRGLDFEKIASARRDPASSDVIITGAVRNVGKRRLFVPRLSYDIRDETGRTLVKWTESAPAARLSAGHVLTFASSPHHLPIGSRTAMITFDDNEGRDGTRMAAR